jgi:hypothetical protein
MQILRAGLAATVLVVGIVALSPNHLAVAAPAVPTMVPFGYIDLDPTDLAIDATRGVAWASLPADSAVSPGMVVAVSTTTGDISSTIDVGGVPAKLEISADASTLYVGLTAGGVAQINLQTKTRTRTFSLGTGYNDIPLQAEDMAIMPGDPTTVVVSTYIPGFSPGFTGLRVFKDGVQLPNTTPGHTGSSLIEMGSLPGHLYGYNGYHTGFDYFRNLVDANGVTQIGGTATLGVFNEIHFADGRLYADGGEVVEPELGQKLFKFAVAPNPSAMAPDAVGRRAYFLELFQVSSPQLEVFDMDTHALVRTWSLPKMISTYSDTPPVNFTFSSPRPLIKVVSPGRLLARSSDKRLYFLNPILLSGTAGEFTPLTPQRILDTRDGTGAASAEAIGPGETIDVQITGRAGVPRTGVTSVVLNATATGSTKPGFITIFPTGDPLPEISNLNFVSGLTVANLVTVALGDFGQVSAYNATGSADLIFDIAGYYASSSGTPGSRFFPVNPHRLLDTRGGIGARVGKAGAGEVIALQVGSGTDAPANVTAVVLNVTAVEATANSFATVYPSDVQKPTVSNLNYDAGKTVPNLVIVRVPASGIVNLVNEFGAAHLLADVTGYYAVPTTPTESGRFRPYSPFRLYDSRSDSAFAAGKSPPGSTLILGPDTPAFSAVALNVTIVDPAGGGFMTVFPYPGTVANVSNLNFAAGQTVPNAVIVQAGPQFAFRNSGGATHILVDVFGVFT